LESAGRQLEKLSEVNSDGGLRGRRDLCRLRFFGKIARLSPEKLLKQVFNLCKPITGNMPTTWCGSTRKLLFDLCLGHVWSSESVGPTKDWEKLFLPVFGLGKFTNGRRVSKEKQAASLSDSEERLTA
jgi:hypothetical protein